MDSFIGLQEFVVGYSKAPEQPQSSARPICHSHTMTSTGRESATIHIAAYCATGDDFSLSEGQCKRFSCMARTVHNRDYVLQLDQISNMLFFYFALYLYCKEFCTGSNMKDQL